MRGEGNSQARLNAEQVRQIRELSADGMPRAEIAKKFGVGKTTVCYVIKRKTWKCVAP